MQNNRLAKILTIILICICVIILFKSNTYASEYSIENIFVDAQNFVQSGNEPETMINTTALKNTSNFIYKLLFSIGLIVAIIVGIVLGIQFMVASAEDKAKIKETLIAYTVGCIVLFGAYGIWKTVINIVQETTSTSECAHSWSEKVIKPSTCTEEGKKERTCTKCNETMDFTIACTPHKYGPENRCIYCGTPKGMEEK